MRKPKTLDEALAYGSDGMKRWLQAQGYAGTDGEPNRDGPWSKPRFAKDWVKLLGLTDRTFLRRRNDGTYHAEKEGQRIKILLRDLPGGID